MKTQFLIFIIFCSFISNAQVGMDEVAAKWQDGPYDVFEVKTDEKFELVLKEGKRNLKFIKDKEGRVTSIDNGYIKYSSGVKSKEDFISSYSNGMSKMYFTDKSIVLYNIIENFPFKVKLTYCYGKKVKENVKEEIEEYLNQTKQHFIPSFVGNLEDYIDSIDLYLLTEDKLSPIDKQVLNFGFRIKFNWGVYSYSQNMGGVVDDKALEYSSSALQNISKMNEKYPYQLICEKVLNNDLSVQAMVARGKKKFISNLKVNCGEDKSIEGIRLARWNIYDQISFVILDKDMNPVKQTINRDKVNSYTNYSETIKKLYSRFKHDKLYVRVMQNDKIGYADSSGKLVIPAEYEDGLIYYEDGLIKKENLNNCVQVKKNGKWGLVDFSNKALSSFTYDEIGEFSEGLAKIKSNGKFGFINKKGNEIGKIEYDDVDNFDRFNHAIVKKDGKYGIINNIGSIVLSISQTIKPVSVSENLFAIGNSDETTKYALINKASNKLVDFKYTEINPVGFDYSNSNEKTGSKYIRVRLYGDGYGYLNLDGTVFIEPKYFNARDFIGTKAYVEYYNNHTTYIGYYDLKTNSEVWEKEIDESVNLTNTNSSSNTSVNNSSTSNNSSSSSSSNSSSKEKDFSGNVYFYYTGVSSDAPEKLYIHYGSNTTQKTSTTRGNYANVPCQKGKVYYSHTGEKKDMKEISEITVDDCNKKFYYKDFK